MIIYGITQDYLKYLRSKMNTPGYSFNICMKMLKNRYEETNDIKFLETIVKEG